MALTTGSIPPDSPLQLATLSESGKPPRMRLSSAFEAQNLFWTLHEAAQPRLALAAKIQGMFDGNAPYNQAKRRNQADAWRSNFNSLEAASRLEAAKTPFYDLLTSSAQLADCDTDIDGQTSLDVAQLGVDAPTASRVRSAAFDTMLRSYASFDQQFWTMFNDFIGFNRGYLWFPKPDSWHFKRLPWWRVYFPDGTSSDPDEWECFAIEHRWPVSKLYKMAADAPKDSGWNFKQVVDAIRHSAPDDLARTWNDPMKLQQMMRDSDLYMNSRVGCVQAASIYTREFDGTWSRMMVETNRQGESRAGSNGIAQSRIERDSAKAKASTDNPTLQTTDWLYSKRSVADELIQIMAPFVFEVGDGSVNELAGLGKRILSISQAKDRMLNSVVDNTMMRSSIVLQAQTGSGQAKAGIIQVSGNSVVLPPGYAVQPATIFGDITGAMAVSQDLDNRLDKNTGTYRPTFEKPTGNPESATAASARFSQATVLSASSVNRFYTQSDKFYAEVYRRATLPLPKGSKDPAIKAANDFQAECARAGLSEAQCRDNKPGMVRAQRAVGNGSPIMRQQTVGALSGLVPYLGPRGLQQWKVMYASAYGTQAVVARLLPPEDESQVPTRDTWDATSENADMKEGNQPVLAGWQNNQTHADVHLRAAFAAVQSVLQANADPAIPFTFLQIAMPHIQQHIAKVPREGIRKELEGAWKQLQFGVRQVEQKAQAHAQGQQQQAALSFEQQLDMQKTQHDIQTKQMVTEARLSQAAQKQQFNQQLAQQQAVADIQLKQQVADADHQLKSGVAAAQVQLQDATTAHTITTGTAQAAADIRIKHAKAEADIEVAKKKAEAKPDKAKD